MKSKFIYPGLEEAEQERSKPHYIEQEPDFIHGCPNYEKFERLGWDTEKTLAWLNID